MFHIHLVCLVVLVKAVVVHSSSLFDTTNVPITRMNFSLSPIYLSHVADRENQIYELIKKSTNLSADSNHSLLIRDYLTDYEECQRVLNRWKVCEHPWLIYRMFWRFAVHISKIISIWSQSDNENEVQLSKALMEDENGAAYPTHEDAIAILVVGIINIQHALNLRARDMAKGNFGPISTGLGLTPQQMMVLANTTFALNFFVYAKDWMDLIEEEHKDQIDAAELLTMQEELMFYHDWEFKNKSEEGDMYIFSQPMSSGVVETWKESELRDWLDIGGFSGMQRERKFRVLALCSNSSLLEVEKRRRRKQNNAGLKCWNDHKKHAYFSISPLKTELISTSPDMYLYPDFLNGNQISTIENLSREQLLNNSGSYLEFAWLDMDLIPELKYLSRKLEFALNLNIAGNASDTLRVTMYNFGAYENFVHHDAFRVPNLPSQLFADRVATILIYMTTVALGGETIFPDLDLVVKPVAGTLLYWENYHSDGRIDWKTFHGPCPPALGNKLFASTFVSKTDNVFTRPCRPL